MEHKERDETIRIKMLDEIADIESFSESYLLSMPEIPWKAIRGFRNIAAHQYGIIDFEDVHKTIIEDIPILKAVLIGRGGIIL